MKKEPKSITIDKSQVEKVPEGVLIRDPELAKLLDEENLDRLAEGARADIHV